MHRSGRAGWLRAAVLGVNDGIVSNASLVMGVAASSASRAAITVAGMAGTCGNAGVLISSVLIGALVSTVGYTPFFVALGVLDIIGAVLLWTLVRERQPDPA